MSKCKARQRIFISTLDGPKRITITYRYSGLAVHSTPSQIVIIPGAGGKWNVTHIASGRLVLRSATKQGAINLARRISKWTNWKQPAEILVKDSKLFQRIKTLSRESKESIWAYV